MTPCLTQNNSDNDTCFNSNVPISDYSHISATCYSSVILRYLLAKQTYNQVNTKYVYLG